MLGGMTNSRNPSRYRAVADRLRAQIRDGTYGPGALLPREEDLAAEFDEDRGTINRALKVLLAEGLVVIKRGKGTYVTKIPVIHRNAASRYNKDSRERNGGRGAFDTEIRALGMTPRSDLTLGRTTGDQLDDDVVEVLLLDGHTEVVVRHRVMYADDIPVQIATSYIPASIADGTPLAEQDSGPGGIVSRFADLGLTQTRITETITIRPPHDDEARTLKMSPDQRLYRVLHVGWAGDRAVEATVHLMPAHHWELEYEFPTDADREDATG